MRTLKFRVFDKHDQRMKQAEMEWFDDMFAFRFDHRGFEEEDNSDVVVMQYTGLKDKNGKDIYEGDIVANFYSEKGKETDRIYLKDVVAHGTYDIGCNGGEYSFEIHGFHVKDEFLYGEMLRNEVKVIGNIHENPELL
jgi:uncharacterized phage protein (TIGR01671 family)